MTVLFISIGRMSHLGINFNIKNISFDSWIIQTIEKTPSVVLNILLKVEIMQRANDRAGVANRTTETI